MAKQKKHQSIEEIPSEKMSVPEDGIGSRIRSARESMGLSQTAFTILAKAGDPKKQGISRTVLVGYEAGHSKPGAREIRLICETLKISPNWLIFGTESNYEIEQASLSAVRLVTDFRSAIRLGMAISVLRSHERSAISSLVLSMAGRELGDLRLSGLFAVATLTAAPTFREIQKLFPKEFEHANAYEVTLEELMKAVAANSPNTNIGNKLVLDEDGEPTSGEWLYQDPKK